MSKKDFTLQIMNQKDHCLEEKKEKYWIKEKWIWKVEMLLVDLDHEKAYVMHIINLKQELNHGIVLKKCIEPLNSIKNRG